MNIRISGFSTLVALDLYQPIWQDGKLRGPYSQNVLTVSGFAFYRLRKGHLHENKTESFFPGLGIRILLHSYSNSLFYQAKCLLIESYLHYIEMIQ
jgi:hypothetical protein